MTRRRSFGILGLWIQHVYITMKYYIICISRDKSNAKFVTHYATYVKVRIHK